MCLAQTQGPIVAASDYVRLYAEQIRAFVPRQYYVLGTDGFGRSDTRAQLRKFFEVDRKHIVVSALHALAEREELSAVECAAAIKKYGIDADIANPMEC